MIKPHPKTCAEAHARSDPQSSYLMDLLSQLLNENGHKIHVSFSSISVTMTDVKTETDQCRR